MTCDFRSDRHQPSSNRPIEGWTEKILPRRTPGNLPRWKGKTFLCGMGGIRARETGNAPSWAGEPAAVEEGGVDPRVHLPTGASPSSLRICSRPCDSPRHCPPQRYMHRWPANLPVVGRDSRIRSDDRRFGRERGSHGKTNRENGHMWTCFQPGVARVLTDVLQLTARAPDQRLLPSAFPKTLIVPSRSPASRDSSCTCRRVQRGTNLSQRKACNVGSVCQVVRSSSLALPSPHTPVSTRGRVHSSRAQGR